MRAALIITILVSVGYQELYAQVLTACRHRQFTFFAEKVDKIRSMERKGIMYYVWDSALQKNDTLLVSYLSEVKSCVCNDSIVAFHINTQSSEMIEYFGYQNHQWICLRPVVLPPSFPLVGILTDGETYEKNKHTLIAPDKVVSQMTLFRADGQRLSKIEQYDVEYRIIVPMTADGLKSMLEEEPRRVIVEKKTLNKE